MERQKLPQVADLRVKVAAQMCQLEVEDPFQLFAPLEQNSRFHHKSCYKSSDIWPFFYLTPTSHWLELCDSV